MRPATSDQNATISTTAAPTDPTSDDAFFDTVAGEDFFDTAATDFATEPLVDSSATTSTTAVSTAALSVTAPWRDGAPVDARYSCKGGNVSPALSWSPAPAGTQQIAVTMVDLDFTSFDHWTLTGLAADATSVAEGDSRYSGPCPPAGTTHTYEITVHYLGAPLPPSSDSGVALRTPIVAATIASAKVTGTFTGS
jgi:phosphatidylethanolamine-binding protein (PEBP) family uncharacterized protein